MFYFICCKVYKEAAYGAGEGIIWLDQVHCLGNESNIHQCMSDGWGQTNCKHNEDVAVSCSTNISNEEVKFHLYILTEF